MRVPRAFSTFGNRHAGFGPALLMALTVTATASRSWAAADVPATAPLESPAPAPRLVLPSIEALHAGDEVLIRWGPTGDSIEELEIQLSLDGGRHYSLRISPELDPRAGRFLWRVPNLASGEARLRVRFGREGHEVEGKPSAPFRITAREGRAAELDQVHEGTWWTGEREFDVPGARDAFSPPAESLGACRSAVAHAVAPRGQVDFAPARAVAPKTDGDPDDEVPARLPDGASPRFFPRRN